MTVCSECGGPTDPDVTHIQHDWDCEQYDDCYIGGDDGCHCCIEVCAACCTDPDCPTRDAQHGHTSSCGQGPNHMGPCAP